MKKLVLCFLAVCILFTEVNSQRKNTLGKKEKNIPKNIILLIGDGMGLSQITAGMIRKKGTLNLEKFTYCGFIKTWSADDLVTDSGAGATAFSIGRKTKNEYIGVDSSGKVVKNLLEYAEVEKMQTGIVVTSSITHATPASFVAHNISRRNNEEIALEYLTHDIEVVIGGGRKYFEQRKDKRNVSQELREKKYDVISDVALLDNYTGQKIFALLADDHLPKAESRKELLSKASNKAISILKKSTKGYFLMIEGSQIDFGGHDNDLEYMSSEMVDFDNTIGKILDLVSKDSETLLVVLADHETGGFAINGGNLQSGEIDAAWTTGKHTASLIPVFAYGPGAEQFSGIYDNTAVFYKLLKFIQARP